MMLLVPMALFAQAPDYARVDRYAASLGNKLEGAAQLDSLLRRVDSQFSLPEEKIRFVFTWMALNLQYDCGSEPGSVVATGNVDQVLKAGKSNCAGYSTLMNYALRFLGFESLTVRGLGKTARKDLYWQEGKMPAINHAWNAVKLNGQWKLMDATWASGEASENCDTILRIFSPFYFFPDPEVFVLSHLPLDSSWQLLEKPVSRSQFIRWPVFHDPFYETGVRQFLPDSGVIKIMKNGLVNFRFTTDKHLTRIAVWSDDNKKLSPEFGSFESRGREYSYSYRVREPGRYFINVSLDGRRTALVYRLEVE
jgi:transglutaminase/protease-like cytokinesis protein 3